jgi:hypothetical protein
LFNAIVIHLNFLPFTIPPLFFPHPAKLAGPRVSPAVCGIDPAREGGQLVRQAGRMEMPLQESMHLIHSGFPCKGPDLQDDLFLSNLYSMSAISSGAAKYFLSKKSYMY